MELAIRDRRTRSDASSALELLTPLPTALTPREREVVTLIAEGLSNAQIARRLVLTPGTVANHVEHILRRLSVRSRTEVAALVAEVGLHRPPPTGEPGDSRLPGHRLAG